ncbi:MAG: alternative ribosome rescue aminoacyl-tRNA hydrolase ArfB [Planctomycetota bacterium]|nr:alternative ribosome rescue aminoacyl-tRNA hydrolase ArfB [Planctomycetota bacterium]
MLVVSASIQIPDDELRFTYARSSGPGGQNVNKVSSKAILHWSPVTSGGVPAEVRERLLALFPTRLTVAGDFVITSERSRDQKQNADDCLEKLREMLQAAAHPPKRRRATKASKGSHRRRLAAKKENSEKKQGRRSPPTSHD